MGLREVSAWGSRIIFGNGGIWSHDCSVHSGDLMEGMDLAFTGAGVRGRACFCPQSGLETGRMSHGNQLGWSHFSLFALSYGYFF